MVRVLPRVLQAFARAVRSPVRNQRSTELDMLGSYPVYLYIVVLLSGILGPHPIPVSIALPILGGTLVGDTRGMADNPSWARLMSLDEGVVSAHARYLVMDKGHLRAVDCIVTTHHLDSMFQYKTIVRQGIYLNNSMQKPGDLPQHRAPGPSEVVNPDPAGTAAAVILANDDPTGSASEDRHSVLDDSYLEGANVTLQHTIIKDWEQMMSPPKLAELVCAACGRFTAADKMTIHKPEEINLSLLCNDVLPIAVFLTTYDRLSDSFAGFSQQNFDALSGEGTTHVDEGVPCAMEVGHIQLSDVIAGSTEGYVPGQNDPPPGHNEDMLMETVGYMDSDNSPVDYNTMTRKALLHCLQQGQFVQCQAGSRFVPDFENSELLFWLFPHLNPWGIGGFHHPCRSRAISLDQQLKYLLAVEGSPFRMDTKFAFVYYNIRQKKAIRGLINHRGTPTLFITLNPSDRDHPLVRLYARHDIDAEGQMRGEELSQWQRTILAAHHPEACARFFDKMICGFVNVILHHGRPGNGLFGKCGAYYGTVEAQGRGTLHCHMLISLDGHPSPQQLRDNMMASEAYQRCMFMWLESVIKCKLPGTTQVIKEQEGQVVPRPKRADESHNPHPGAVAAPSITMFARLEDFEVAMQSHVTELVKEFNWHEHNLTCFKYIAQGVVPTDASHKDALCRMHIDGTTFQYGHKFIGSGEAAKALLYYVTDYITKLSLPAHVGLSALSYAVQRVNEKFPHMQDDPEKGSSRGALTLTVNHMLSHQEISHQQVMSYLVGGGDYYSSHTFHVLHWGAFDRLFISEGYVSHTPLSMDDTADPTSIVTEDIDKDNDNVPALNEITSVGDEPQNVDSDFDKLLLYEFVGGVEKIKRDGKVFTNDLRSNGNEVDVDEANVASTIRSDSRHRGGCSPAPRGEFWIELTRSMVLTFCENEIVGLYPSSWVTEYHVLIEGKKRKRHLKTKQDSWTEAFERRRSELSAKDLQVIANMNVLSECRDVRDVFRTAYRSEALASMAAAAQTGGDP
ncbi:hypothetical protein NUW54_g1326 [Trametes sanguinea]|uniref:Uncharacterized protein n=1 Tax=Trametes sanguinea TaxID=158606 RepID=A0ACC1Q8J8_9APHY|nr:hypothetical protein NUW54_g1326 [Trametes sanguinea]